MALTESSMLALGCAAADFSLPDVISGRELALAADYRERGVGIAAINANDVQQYPADAPDKMAALAHQRGFGFPYLFDASQQVARVC